MSEKIVLIDGHSILNRAFYGVPDLTNAEGLHTNAIYGFLNILFKILDEEKPEYLAVAFDVHAPTFRHEMYAEYKGTRKAMSEELRQQVPVMKEVLAAMGVCIVEQAGLEADDILGTIARSSEENNLEVSVVSGDRDLLQLATDKVKIRIPKTKQGKTEIEDYYAQDVKMRYEVTPKEFIDVKALMGDASDNIPGVPSIGEKTATKIIVEYGSLEHAYECLEELKPPRAANALKEHYELAQLSKTLATIEVNAPFAFEKERMKIRNLFTEEAYAFFQRLQFKNLLNKFNMDAQINDVEKIFVHVDKLEIAEKVFRTAKTQATVGVAIYKDTDNVLPLFATDAVIGGLCIAYGDKDVYIIKARGYITSNYLLEQVKEIAQTVECFAAFDIKELLHMVPIKQEENCFDMTVAAYLINPIKNDYTYEDVAREYMGVMIDAKASEEIKGAYEAYTAFVAMPMLVKKLEETGLKQLFITIEMPLVFTLFRMEVAGVKIEAEALHFYGSELGVRIVELEKEIHQLAGEVFNINSPKQLGIVLFERLELPLAKKTKTGYSTAAEVLEKLAPDYGVVAKILEYRQLSKLKSTYADGLANYIGADGRIHGKFNQTITATGRISSTEPNLQNIPIRMELGRLIRKVFIPEKDYVFVDADYSQIELRILAHCSGDEQLIRAYKEAKDIHRITASQVFHIPFDEVTEVQRRNAKAVNFGIVYGISSFGLSQDLSISKKDAGQYIERYFDTYPRIKSFLDDTVEFAKEQGYVVTLFGRRRPVPELSSSNFMQRSFGERVAMNAPIQGTAADIMKIAMIGVDHALKERKMKSRLVLQVHDELLIEAHKSEIDEVKKILVDEMGEATQLDVPLEIDMHTGDNWYEAK